MHPQQFGDDCKLRRAIGTPEGRDAIQRDLDELEKWAHGNSMRFNKASARCLHMDQGNFCYQHRLKKNRPKAALARRSWECWWVTG